MDLGWGLWSLVGLLEDRGFWLGVVGKVRFQFVSHQWRHLLMHYQRVMVESSFQRCFHHHHKLVTFFLTVIWKIYFDHQLCRMARSLFRLVRMTMYTVVMVVHADFWTFLLKTQSVAGFEVQCQQLLLIWILNVSLSVATTFLVLLQLLLIDVLGKTITVLCFLMELRFCHWGCQRSQLCEHMLTEVQPSSMAFMLQALVVDWY